MRPGSRAQGLGAEWERRHGVPERQEGKAGVLPINLSSHSSPGKSVLFFLSRTFLVSSDPSVDSDFGPLFFEVISIDPVGPS